MLFTEDQKINIFWFRRDLRIDDNTGLGKALGSGLPVMPLFIFDTNIIGELPAGDPRITFIYDTLASLNSVLSETGSSILIAKGDPVSVWKELLEVYRIDTVFINKDYEPYAISRDSGVESVLRDKGVSMVRSKDQVIFEEKEILKEDNNPYTVFTPYKNRWIARYQRDMESLLPSRAAEMRNFLKHTHHFPSLEKLGFRRSSTRVRPCDLSVIRSYHLYRDLPAEDRTTYLGPHLRFGTVSIRKIVQQAWQENETFLGELVWREFFMQILFNFPHVITGSFKKKYDGIQWRNNTGEFERWCSGDTGYPLVDAGMRQLNETGYMHNRVRMVTASFLVKHLLIDWRWGEAWFASRLLDYELSSNNGNWQWSAGTGCDAAPYFRIFNPQSQMHKFDPGLSYVSEWVPEYGLPGYTVPIVDNDFARKRALAAYQDAIRQ